MQALNAKNFAHAQELFSILVKKEPSALNLAYLAVADVGAGNLGQAIADFRRSIEMGNDSTLTRYGLGSTYLRNNEPEAAIRQLRLVIARDPSYVPALYTLGVALLSLTRPRDAIPYLEQAQRKSPDNAQYRITLVQAQFEAGNSSTAVELVQEATEAIPENPQLLVALAQ